MNDEDRTIKITGDNTLLSFDVIEYKGDNAEEMVRALGLEPGDMIVMADKGPILMRKPDWEQFLRDTGNAP